MFVPKSIVCLKDYSWQAFSRDLIAGDLLVVMGFSRLGGPVKFIPYPITTGFTSGIAVVIFSGQVNDLLGIDGALNRARQVLGLPEVLEPAPRVAEVARDRKPLTTIFVREPPAAKT